MRSDARKIFEKAGVSIEGNEELLFEKIAGYLGDLNAMQSVTMGLTWTRVRQYQKQMDCFIKDLKKMKKAGKLAATPKSAPPPTLP